MLSFVDLFAGIGGVSLAAEAAGFTLVAHAEIEPFCCRVLHCRWPEVPNLGNVHTITAQSFRERGIGRIDLLHASPPCQGLSGAGKQQGAADARYLWPDTYRIVAETRPASVLIENVSGAVPLVLDDWLIDLEGQGYTCWPLLIPAAAVGAPHQRERLFVLALANESPLADSERLERQRGRDAGELGGSARADEGKTWEREWLWDSASDRGSTLAVQPLGGTHPVGTIDNQTQPRVRRGVDGVSSWLDGRLAWPALPDQAPYAWEPAPMIEGVILQANRPQRIKALGNAVVPAQVYPLLCALAQVL